MKTCTTSSTPTGADGATVDALSLDAGIHGRIARRTAMAWAVALLATLLILGAAATARAGIGIAPGFNAMLHDQAGNEVTQAGAHPNGTVEFMLSTVDKNGIPTITGALKDGDVTLPAGFVGDPQATLKCTQRDFAQGIGFCSRLSMVGMAWVTFAGLSMPGMPTDTYDFPVYNIEPPKGVAARFAFQVMTVSVILDTVLKADGDYHLVTSFRNTSESLVIYGSKVTLWGVPADMAGDGPLYAMGLGNYGGPSGAMRKPLLTAPSWCEGPKPVTSMRVNAWQQPDFWATASYTSSSAPTGCDRLKFEPTFEAKPETATPDSPSGLSVDIGFPQSENPDGLATPPLRKAVVTLPEGMTINPASASGLQACSDQQLGLGNDDAVACPEASKIGSVTAKTPVLEEPVEGSVYVLPQRSDDPESGEMFRIAMVMEHADRGVRIKLEGQLRVNKDTGRIETTFDNNPQLPVSELSLRFKSGPRAPLATPSTCGPKTVNAQFTSWGGQVVDRASTFQIACTPGLGAFAPSFAAGTVSPVAGLSSPFTLRVGKADGQSALNGVAMVLPKGLLANLKGNIGSQVGTARVAAGPGTSPYWFTGPVVLEGAYGDAPFSLRVTVPAKAGPFDLGDVVVRQKLYVDPNDAHVTVVSDPLPTIVKGVPVRLQNLAVDVDKPGFMLNPTSCEAQAVSGTLGAATGQSVAVSSRFQVGGCGDLKYAPKLGLRLRGNKRELRNGGHPRLNATLTTKSGEANQRKVQVTLPLNLALDPKNAKALCEPSAVPTNSCPQDSVVGKAKAVSILDVPLEGPVYFVRGERTTSTGRVVATLPKLFIPLSGQGVRINLHASSDVVDRKLQTTFENLPDAPIESFDLQINGGANGILKVSNGDVCRSTSTPRVGQRFTGQNGKAYRATSTLGTACRFGIAKTARKGNRVTVTVGGLTGGKITVSGKGIAKNHRSVSSRSSVASVGVSLNAASRRALKQGRTLRLKVKASFNPSAKGEKTVSKTKTLVTKPAKKK